MTKTKGSKAIEKQNQVLEQLKIEYIPFDEITPNDYNPNRQSEHEFELLIKSMREDGFTQPILVMSEGKIIVDGEHRWRAAKALYDLKTPGFTTGLIPVVFVNMTAAQMKIATLRHNRARGTEDVELTAQLLRDLEKLGALDWAQDSLLLDDTEINRLIDDMSAPEALAGAEYEQAWVPDLVAETDKETHVYKIEGSNIETALSFQASDEIRVREQNIKLAKTEQERATIRKDSNLERISLTFTKEEYPLIKETLGNQPAVTLLQLCRKAKEQGWTPII